MQNWPTKKLGEVVYFQEGPGLRTFQFQPSGIRVINVANVQDGFLDLTETKYLDQKEIEEKYQHFLVNEGDILLSTSGTIGRVARVRKEDLPLMLNTSVMRLHSLNENTLLNQFLFYFLNNEGFRRTLLSYKTGVAIFNVGPSHLKRIWLILPPLHIQRQIVERLDTIRKTQELNDKQIALAEEVFQSLLRQELNPKGKNWEVEKLREVCDFYNGQAHEKYINENGNFVVINSKFIASNGMKYKKTNNALFPLLRGDITMVMSDVPKGQALAKCFFVDKNDTYTLNQRICAIRSKNFENKFLYYQLNRNRYFLRFDNGQSQTNLRKDDILDCPLLIPPLETQRQIVEKLQAVQDYKKKLSEQKQKLKQLFDSCLDKAMKGE